MKVPNRLLLVDGSNLLFQMFYGMPSRIVNKNGKAIHGTLGFTGALLKIIRRVEPTHIAVLFDGEHENPRTALDENYKANRPDFSQIPEADTPFSQLPDIYAALDYLSIAHTEITTYETDDIIAGYVRKYSGEVEIVISSFDSDFFQLITDSIHVLRYRGEKTVLCTPAYIQEKLGIPPARYADFKALTGDTADNIRGAEKIGPKTAAALINRFGSLENILRCAEEIQKPSVRKSVIRDAARLKTNYALIRLDGDVSLPFTLDKLLYTPTRLTTTEVLKGIGLK